MISDEAVEAAARILLQTSVNRFVEPREKALNLCKAEVRPILEAAAPYMLGESWEGGYTLGFMDCANKQESSRPNPYRSQA